MREALKSEKLPVGQGWKDVTANSSENTPQGVKLRAYVQKYFTESIITGDRYVQLYEVSGMLTSAILRKLENVVVSESAFSSSYPLPLDQELLSTAPSEPVLCEVRPHDNGDVSLILCSARSHDDSMSYTYSQLPQHVQNTYRQIDKLVTYRKVYYQAYDVVTIRTNLERIEICVDQPAKAGAVGLETLPLRMLSACALSVSDFTGMGAIPPANLFPAIAGMYAATKEGKVTALSFRTLTGSIKKERMTADTVDLREEKFHHAGMNALGQKISPYELALDFEFKFPDGQATLKLSALIRELASATPTLHGCYVTSATSSSFERTLNRLVTYLN